MEKVYKNKDIMLNIFSFIYGNMSEAHIKQIINLQCEKHKIINKIEYLHERIMNQLKSDMDTILRIEIQNNYFKELKYNYFLLNLKSGKIKEIKEKNKKIL